ncbi:3-oxoacyl-[acyl-carrier-protein] synthase, KASII [Euzebya pacifica]|uniref:3-oxoacyl-[acyl-carrier-protein] synthase 2 n=1 Tax=Euzebya pacifica TaxID=1608957 RepID=A0A346XYM0_9ACTN|nr:beta-ketoacyl-ACP synthase II [Euzebya pacifica]AXV07317.1 3-oxoacyl-[acyl-carrier-protein] synthase, KASII [Euzebya pacifica]
MSTPVAITGIGLVTPGGIGAAASWEAVLRGESTATPDPVLEGMDVDFSCRIPDFDANALLGRRARKLDRFVQLALVAAREAIADADLDHETWDGPRVGVVLGCGMGGAPTWEEQHGVLMERGPNRVSPHLIPRMIPNMAAGHIAMDFGAHGPNLATATACASGATAIGYALDLLRVGRCDIVIAGGTEAGITPLSIAGFNNMTALSTRRDDPTAASRPFDAGRDGFVAAEAAGVLVLERVADADARGVRTYAKLAGYGASADGHHVTAPDPQGAGGEMAVRAALADAGLEPGDIDHVNAHGTSTPLNDVSEARMIARVLGDRPAVTSTKGVTGHALGGAGAIEAAFSALTLHHQVIPPTANLDSQDPEIQIDVVSKAPRETKVEAVISDSFGFGGQNAVLAFTA